VRRTLALLALLALAACRPEAQASPSPDDALQAAVDSWRQRTPVPGVVAIVSRDGEADRFVVSGTEHRGGLKAVTVDSRFRAASITKMLVATVVLQLEEEGRLKLDDAVAGHLPRRLPISKMLDGVTVRHLLSHASGLPDSGRSPELTEALVDDTGHRWTVDEVLRIVAKREPEFSPGSGYDYSNTNYLVLGELIEGVTGKPWHTEVRERILDPVRMASSYLAGVEEPTGPLTPGYFDLDNDGVTQKVPAPWPALETSEGPAGALVSTAPDLMRFLKAFTAGELVPRAAVQKMTEPGSFASRHSGYGMGVEVLQPDLENRAWGHGGLVPGYRAILWHVPSEKTSVVVLTNESRSRPDGLAEILLRTAYSG
jgi:D-alanyl-D-alanine carboxypeptidase